ncbi:unnamed protein product [Dicrocoelium dendriticum]|nr:unnamed protein product [Dicrocoelium dendriticum]
MRIRTGDLRITMQGMSELVGLFLTYIVEEEDVFWALCQLMGSRKHGMHGLYSRDFPGLYRLFEQHEQVLERLLPAISKHFKTQDLPTSTYALKWFMQCFLNRLPVSLVLRLWDIYLLEGEKILIGMAFNILKMHKKQLLTMDQSQITCFLQDELVKDFRYDDDTVIESLQECLEQLRRSKVYRPPTPTYNMFPTRSFGSLGADMVWQSHPIAASKHSLPEVTAAITVNSVHSDGSLRPLRKKNSTSGKSLYNPPVREPLKVNCDPSFFPSLVTPASVLTMSAISSHSRNSQLSATPEPSLFLHENRSRLPDRVEPIASPSTDSHTSGPRIITVRSPSSSARSSSQWPPNNIKMSPSSPTGTSSPIPSSSPLLYGYATTDSKRYRAVKAAYSHSISPSPHDSTNDPRPPSHGSGVVLMSVRPRQFDRTQDYFINRLAGDLLENAQLSTVPRQRAAEGDRSDTLCDSHSRLDDTDGRLTPSTFSSTSGAEDHSQLWKYRGQPYEPCSTGQVNHSGGAIEEQKRHPTSERDRLSQLIADVNADVSSPREKSDTLVPPSSLRYILVDSESGNELPATPSSNQVASNEVSLRELHMNSCAPPEVPPHRPRSFYTPTTSPSLLPKDGKPPTGLSPSARRRRMFSVGLPPPYAPMRLAPHQCRPLPGQPN